MPDRSRTATSGQVNKDNGIVEPHRFRDLGPTHFEQRINQHRKARNLATALQAITGQTITIRDGKAVISEPAVA